MPVVLGTPRLELVAEALRGAGRSRGGEEGAHLG
jgi:hypothetical protein